MACVPVDVFYVKDVFGLKIENERKLGGLRDALLAALDARRRCRESERWSLPSAAPRRCGRRLTPAGKLLTRRQGAQRVRPHAPGLLATICPCIKRLPP